MEVDISCFGFLVNPYTSLLLPMNLELNLAKNGITHKLSFGRIICVVQDLGQKYM